MTTLARAFALVALMSAVGCGSYIDTPSGEQVDVTGKVTVAGKSVGGFQIVLQPTGGAGQQVFFPLKSDGSFAGKANAATYTYYLQAGTTGEQALERLPKDARAGSMQRVVEVKAGGAPLELKL